MGRRPSSQEEKKAAKAKAEAAKAKAAAAAPPEETPTDRADLPEPDVTEICDPVQEIEAPTAASSGAPAVLEDLDPEDPGPSTVPKRGPLAPPKAHPIPTPNKPSFDWKIEDGDKVPNLLDGEDVVGEYDRDGIPYVRTSRTRFIFLVTAAEYEKAFGVLPSRQVFIEAFPQAFPKKDRPKG